MKKRKQLWGLAVAGLLMLSACGGTADISVTTAAAGDGTAVPTEAAAAAAAGMEEAVKLTLWADFVTPERTEYVERMVSGYMAAHPNVTIEVTPLPDNADDKIMTAYEAGQGPDIFLSSGPDITSHINGEYIIPLDSYFDMWEGKTDILESAVDTVRQFDITGKDQMYYIPNGISFTVLWVRSDWLAETASSVETWNDLFQAAEQMTDKSASRYGIAIRGGKGGAKFLERQMYAYSGILSKFDDNGVCTLNNPKHVEFVERYLGLYGTCTAEGDINYGWTELAAAFDSGAAGMIIHNLGSAADHMKAFGGDQTKFEAIGMPLNDNGTSVNLMIQPGGMSIASTCKNPQAAFDFITYMSSGEPVSEYCQQWGVVPVNRPVLENAVWFKGQPWYQASADLLLDENTLFYEQYSWLPGHDSIYGEMDTQSQYVMAGEMTAQELLDNWAKEVQKCYDGFYHK